MCRSDRPLRSTPPPPVPKENGDDNDTAATTTTTTTTIGDYLIHRLAQYGVHHVFGIPGDYVLGFFNKLEMSTEIDVIGCCREDCAGFAADGYARMNGMGAVCVTYCVGGFSTLNAIAGAAAEDSAVVMITGSPGLSERHGLTSLHHGVNENWDTQRNVFAQVCAATTILNDPPVAAREIDRVLDTCFRQKKPVYIEIPRDVVAASTGEILYSTTPIPIPHSHSGALTESCRDAHDRIVHSHKPVIVAGVDLSRYGLENELLALAETVGIPITTLMMGKGVIAETHPLFAGIVYHDDHDHGSGLNATAQLVEESDCIILLGLIVSDLDQFIYGHFATEKCINVAKGQVKIGHRHYQNVMLGDFIQSLTTALLLHPTNHKDLQPVAVAPHHPCWSPPPPMTLDPLAPITIRRTMCRLNELLTVDNVIVADVGDSMFAATALTLRGPSAFFSSAFYASMGFAVPAAIGVKVARPECRPIVIVGDGAFQMTGMELSTAIKNQQNPIVLVLDNAGYGTERLLHPGETHAYNSIQPWNYHLLPTVLGGGTGCLVETEGGLDTALLAAFADDTQLHLIQIKLDPNDASDVLQRMAKILADQVCN